MVTVVFVSCELRLPPLNATIFVTEVAIENVLATTVPVVNGIGVAPSNTSIVVPLSV